MPAAIVEKEYNHPSLDPKSFDPQGKITDDDPLPKEFQVKVVKLNFRLC